MRSRAFRRSPLSRMQSPAFCTSGPPRTRRADRRSLVLRSCRRPRSRRLTVSPGSPYWARSPLHVERRSGAGHLGQRSIYRGAARRSGRHRPRSERRCETTLLSIRRRAFAGGELLDRVRRTQSPNDSIRYWNTTSRSAGVDLADRRRSNSGAGDKFVYRRAARAGLHPNEYEVAVPVPSPALR